MHLIEKLSLKSETQCGSEESTADSSFAESQTPSQGLSDNDGVPSQGILNDLKYSSESLFSMPKDLLSPPSYSDTFAIHTIAPSPQLPASLYSTCSPSAHLSSLFAPISAPSIGVSAARELSPFVVCPPDYALFPTASTNATNAATPGGGGAGGRGGGGDGGAGILSTDNYFPTSGFCSTSTASEFDGGDDPSTPSFVDSTPTTPVHFYANPGVSNPGAPPFKFMKNSSSAPCTARCAPPMTYHHTELPSSCPITLDFFRRGQWVLDELVTHAVACGYPSEKIPEMAAEILRVVLSWLGCNDEDQPPPPSVSPCGGPDMTQHQANWEPSVWSFSMSGGNSPALTSHSVPSSASTSPSSGGRTPTKRHPLIKAGIGGPNFAAPKVLVHPSELKNPSSFLKIYGDPMCAKGMGAKTPVRGANGNWGCKLCNSVNFPRRFRCNSCEEYRDAEGDAIVAAYAMKVYEHHLVAYRAMGTAPKWGEELPPACSRGVYSSSSCPSSK